MPLVSSSKIVPFDSATYPVGKLRRTRPLFKVPRPRSMPNYYDQQMQAHRPVQVDPYSFPAGALSGLGGLGDLAGATGIPAIDAVVNDAQVQLAAAKRALQITAVASAIAAVCGLILVADRR
ncbi:MAG: hypothetical protein ABIR60_08660 [Allosphingosinicella sp.]